MLLNIFLILESIHNVDEPYENIPRGSRQTFSESSSIKLKLKSGTIINSGSCGNQLTWQLDSIGVVSITGTG